MANLIIHRIWSWTGIFFFFIPLVSLCNSSLCLHAVVTSSLFLSLALTSWQKLPVKGTKQADCPRRLGQFLLSAAIGTIPICPLSRPTVVCPIECFQSGSELFAVPSLKRENTRLCPQNWRKTWVSTKLEENTRLCPQNWRKTSLGAFGRSCERRWSPFCDFRLLKAANFLNWLSFHMDRFDKRRHS